MDNDAMKSKTQNINAARRAKNDEFYTLMLDIEQECAHYWDHFRGKAIMCNCDDPRQSNFFRYFYMNFRLLNLKRLIATCYKNNDADLFSTNSAQRAIYCNYDGAGSKDGIVYGSVEEYIRRNTWQEFSGDGDFRSNESIALLKQADVVVTNPPFSLFREYVAQLVEYDKKFLILGSMNAITYKEIFKLIMENKIWLGFKSMGTDMLFGLPADYATELVENKKEGSAYKKVNGEICGRTSAIWYTNLDIRKRHEEIILYKQYNPALYPRYDNYDAIEVSQVKDMPCDYDGIMGLPISFMDKYNPAQFEILGLSTVRELHIALLGEYTGHPLLNGKPTYRRLFIRRKPEWKYGDGTK
jgi:hypothetical protein